MNGVSRGRLIHLENGTRANCDFGSPLCLRVVFASRSDVLQYLG
jgi:hypothetical protein